PKTDPASQWLLVAYAVQRQAPLPCERPEALLARDKEQDAHAERRRLAHALRRREVAWQRQGVQLAARARWAFLARHPRLLGEGRNPRWIVEAAYGESEVTQ